MDIMRFFLLLVVVFMVGCVSVARVADFSETSEIYDFDELAKRSYDEKDPIWNQKGEYDYFIVVDSVNEDELLEAITDALSESGHGVRYSSKSNRAVIGERGLRMNEWNTVTGIYYRPHEESFQVYVRSKITQDFTGGWRENRARDVADEVCSLVGTCRKN